MAGSRILQVSNISPSATTEQVRTLFSYVGGVEECKVYPADSSTVQTQPKIAYIRFDRDKDVVVGQHLTNIVFIDRALICVPVLLDSIPGEDEALQNAGSQAAMLGQRQLPAHLIQQEQELEDGSKVIITVDPMMKSLGVPQYPPLPGDTDSAKVEEIRRTVYVGNLDKVVDGEDLMDFFSTTIGEVMYLRMAAGNERLPCAYAYVEFTNQSSVPVALQNDGIEYQGRPLKIQHSKVALIKPHRKTADQAMEEVEEAIKNKDKGKGMVSDRLPPPEKLRRRSPSRSPSNVREPEEGRRSHSRRDRRSPSYSGSSGSSRSYSSSSSPDRGGRGDRNKRERRDHRGQRSTKDRRGRHDSRSRRSPSPSRGKRGERSDRDRGDRKKERSDRHDRDVRRSDQAGGEKEKRERGSEKSTRKRERSQERDQRRGEERDKESSRRRRERDEGKSRDRSGKERGKSGDRRPKDRSERDKEGGREGRRREEKERGDHKEKERRADRKEERNRDSEKEPSSKEEAGGKDPRGKASTRSENAQNAKGSKEGVPTTEEETKKKSNSKAQNAFPAEAVGKSRSAVEDSDEELEEETLRERLLENVGKRRKINGGSSGDGGDTPLE